MKPRTILPLSLVFATILQGCIGGSCPDVAPSSFDLTADDILAIDNGADIWSFVVGGASVSRAADAIPVPDTDIPDSDVSDTDVSDTDVSDTDVSDTDVNDTGVNDTDSLTPICDDVCDNLFSECVGTPEDRGDGVTRYTCKSRLVCIGGRMHATITTPDRASGPTPLATWLAQASHDEAASVAAFRALADELRAHGLPTAMLTRIHAAADDEVRHAAAMSALALAEGGCVPNVTTETFTPRSLEQIATENAVEACVLETWAALRAAHQAQHASTLALRQVFQEIAEEETRHAELARDLQAWMETRLSAEAVTRVHAARDAMITRLMHGPDLHVDEPLVGVLGLPRAEQSQRMLGALSQQVWAKAA